MTKSFYDTRARCSVPAPSLFFSAGEWMTIVGQYPGKGNDRPGSSAGSEEGISARFASEFKIQNSKCKMVRRRQFCILNFEFCISLAVRLCGRAPCRA